MNAISVTVMYFLPVDAEQREDFWGESLFFFFNLSVH